MDAPKLSILSICITEFISIELFSRLDLGLAFPLTCVGHVKSKFENGIYLESTSILEEYT